MKNSEQKADLHPSASISQSNMLAAAFRPTKAQKEVLNEMKKGYVLRYFVASRMVDSRFYLIDENGQLNDVNGFVGRNLVKSGLLEFIGTTGKNKDYRLK